jgi:squalene-hopene/tetraprenyl-beta-curcumene cyclase
VSSSAEAAEARERLVRMLRGHRQADGHWVGELSPSALSTATALGALALARQRGLAVPETLLAGGRRWLAAHRNADGGYGDTPLSASNVSTTALAWGAFALAGVEGDAERAASAAAEAWLRRKAGGVAAGDLARVLAERYGKDRTFSAPILTFLTISGRLGPDAWRHVAALPFELAMVPARWLGAVRLPVVSYALPALIAIGQVRHRHRATRNPLTALARRIAREPTLRTLARVQPSSGGYLEAVPLTSFVLLSLLAMGRARHPVVERGLEFLIASARADGSWAIDSDLACWVTTLSVVALGRDAFTDEEARVLRAWILGGQYRETHAYTNAAPGGWAWTHRPGGVPDADDTAGALLALAVLDGADDPAARAAAASGVRWLLGLQNGDGGIPTFCRGWGALDFDRSTPELTAHAIRAWSAWRTHLPAADRDAVDRSLRRAASYLARARRPDGSWVPLWFGNEAAPGEENPVYGTARVLPALALVQASESLATGRAWLMAAQNADGGWGGAPGVASSLEETSLAVASLSSSRRRAEDDGGAVARGVRWIVDATDGGRTAPPSPIGLYFARLWYYEQLYPLVFSVDALRAASTCGSR